MSKGRLLSLRARINRRRPKFIRAEWHRLKRLQTSWRRPKGIDSKMREARKGKRKSPGTGYRGPRQVRGLHPSGKELIRILSVRELKDIDPENQIVQIGSKVGSRKRTEIINEAEDLDIHVVNPQIRRLEFEEVEEDFVDTDEFEGIDDDDDIVLDDDFELLEDEEGSTE